MGGLEPPTPASQTRCAGPLRYTPATSVSIIRRVFNRQAKLASCFLLTLSVLFGLLGCAADLQAISTPTAIPASPTLRATSTPAPSPTVTATAPPCTASPGVLHNVTLPSAAIPRFQIYLPPCYQSEPNRHFATLYLFHGATYDDGQWPRLGVIETANRLIAEKEIPPFLIVMPYDRASWRNPKDDLFDQVVLTDLIPYVDAHYRTLPNRRYRAIGGLSRGAGWALRLGLTRPDLFGLIGLHSPVVFYQDQFQIKEWLGNLPVEARPDIYLDIGQNDKERGSAAQLVSLLEEAQIPHTWQPDDGAHDEAYWKTHVEDYLRWYGAHWNVP